MGLCVNVRYSYHLDGRQKTHENPIAGMEKKKRKKKKTSSKEITRLA